MINLYNKDCMEAMKDMADNQYDLAIVDPPYGINYLQSAVKKSFGKAAAAKNKYTIKDWDKSIPSKQYFKNIFRVSKNQIIWGGNYITKYIKSSKGWIFWDKDNGTNNFSDGELAYTSFNRKLTKVKILWNGMLQYDMKNKEDRIHPTQKPIALYEWLLMNYAKEGDKILDTHLGSGSIAIACHNLGYDLDAYEIDKEYYEATMKRFNNHKLQTQLWT